MKPVIRVDRLSKRYRIGLLPTGRYRTLRETVVAASVAPWRKLQEIIRRENGAATSRNGQTPPDMIWALQDISFEVNPGEVVGIIGRNGAGKSTLLKILSQIVEPTSGRAELYGRVGSLLEVGTGFHPELTGRENIYLNGAILGMSHREIQKKFDEIVAFAEIDRFLDTPVKRYSSGMYVRLAFAVAAHLEPEILVVDEVLAVGDQEFQKKCLGRMNDVSRSGRTVLFVSHNMAAVANLCQDVIVLDHGRIVYTGDAKSGIDVYLGNRDARTAAIIDLTNHPRRRPGSRPILKKVRLLNKEGISSNQFPCGEPLAVELDIDPRGYSGTLHLNIRVEDATGIMLFCLGTHITDSKLPPLDGPRRLLCQIEELPLAPGQYFLTLQAGSILEPTWADTLDQVVSLEVAPSDFYRNGRLPSVGRGWFTIRSRWTAAELC